MTGDLRDRLAEHPMLDQLTNRQLDAIVEIVAEWRRPAPAVKGERRHPVPGEVWRERRGEYSKRTVVVIDAGAPDSGGFVQTRSLTNYQGKPFSSAPVTRTRLSNWHKTFEFDAEAEL